MRMHMHTYNICAAGFMNKKITFLGNEVSVYVRYVCVHMCLFTDIYLLHNMQCIPQLCTHAVIFLIVHHIDTSFGSSSPYA